MTNSLSVETVLSQKDNYNLAFPFLTEHHQINPYYKLSVALLYARTDQSAKEICKIGSHCIGQDKWEDLYYLEKKFLERLAGEACIQFPQATDVVRVDENTWKASALGALRLPNGCELRTSCDCKVIDLVTEEKKYRLAYEEKAANGITDYKAAKDASGRYKGAWVDTGTKNEKGYPVKKYVIEEGERSRYIEKSLLDAMTQLRASAPQKAATGAKLRVIRSLLGIKNTYTMDELKKPFAVARMVFSPDYNDPTVKQMMFQMCFQSVGNLFGNIQPAVQAAVSQQNEAEKNRVERAEFDYGVQSKPQEQDNQYIDGTYTETDTGETAADNPVQDNGVREQDFYCDKCGVHIAQKVWDYSVEKMGRPLCYKCQKIARDGQIGGRR